ncbi:Sacsin [Chionoecetes opilio]|uniref:Sacsin n=1 Tax=Chionoecetes opilio TaxID=41210 RepID=A0A8J8WCH7_CHIOP|nr:Sacsin [Chionoecetes opilio]
MRLQVIHCPKAAARKSQFRTPAPRNEDTSTPETRRCPRRRRRTRPESDPPTPPQVDVEDDAPTPIATPDLPPLEPAACGGESQQCHAVTPSRDAASQCGPVEQQPVDDAPAVTSRDVATQCEPVGEQTPPMEELQPSTCDAATQSCPAQVDAGSQMEHKVYTLDKKSLWDLLLEYEHLLKQERELKLARVSHEPALGYMMRAVKRDGMEYAVALHRSFGLTLPGDRDARPPFDDRSGGRGDPFTYNTIEVPTVVGLLRNILTQYPDNGQIIKELVQNAEDAGATKVALVHVPCDLQYPEADQVVQRFCRWW